MSRKAVLAVALGVALCTVIAITPAKRWRTYRTSNSERELSKHSTQGLGEARSRPVFTCPVSWPESRLPSDRRFSGASLSTAVLAGLGWQPFVNGTRSRLFAKGDHILKIAEMGWPHCTYSLGVNECAVLNFARCGRVESCPSSVVASGMPHCVSLSRAIFEGDPVHVVMLSRVHGKHINDAFVTEHPPHFSVQLVYRGLEIIGRLQKLGISHRDLDASNMLVGDDGGVHLIDFALATAPVLAARGRPPLDLGRERPPDALSCGYDDVYSYIATVRRSLQISRQPGISRGLLAVFKLALSSDCRQRINDPHRLMRLLDSFGYTEESIAPCFAANAHARAPAIEELNGTRCIGVDGYQRFNICADALVTDDPYLHERGAAILRNTCPSGSTVVDVGGNAGYFTWLLLQHGAKEATIVEEDPAAIGAGVRIRDRIGASVAFQTFDWLRRTDVQADIVLALAIVHWLFSCSEAMGSLELVVSFLRKLTSRLLIVEWVDPADAAISRHHHTLDDPTYSVRAFEAALRSNFHSFRVIGRPRPHRSIYLASVESEAVCESSESSERP